MITSMMNFTAMKAGSAAKQTLGRLYRDYYCDMKIAFFVIILYIVLAQTKLIGSKKVFV